MAASMAAMLGFGVLWVPCLLSVAGALAGASNIGFGPCPAKEVVQNFNVSAYAGRWYTQEHFFQPFLAGGKCAQAQYTLDPSGGKILVKNIQRQLSSNKETSVEGYAEPVNPNAEPLEAKLDVVLNVPVAGNQRAPYWVLETDYDNYALVYSCVSVFRIFQFEGAWILTRTPAVTDPNIKQTIESAIQKAKLSRNNFIKDTQDCGELGKQ